MLLSQAVEIHGGYRKSDCRSLFSGSSRYEAEIHQLVNGRYPGSTTFYTDDRCIVIPGDLVTVFFVAT